MRPRQSPAAPAAPAETPPRGATDETFHGEIVMPDVESDADPDALEAEPESDEGAAEAHAAAAPTVPAPRPAPPPAPTAATVPAVPPPAVPPPPVPVPPPAAAARPSSAREERAKRKSYAALWEQATIERDEAIARARAAESLLTGQPTQEALSRHLDELRAKADSVEKLSEVLNLALGEMDRRDRLAEQRLAAMQYRQDVALAQLHARQRWADYDEVLAKAGIYEAIQPAASGGWRDPALAQLIYYFPDGSLRRDPATRAYELAKGRLEYEGRDESAGPPAEAVAATNGAPTTPVAAVAAPAVAPDAAMVAAERRGAQRVIEQVNQARSRGIRAVRSAGQPAPITRQQLDELMERDPQRYERLMAANPDLERFHLG